MEGAIGRKLRLNNQSMPKSVLLAGTQFNESYPPVIPVGSSRWPVCSLKDEFGWGNT